MEQIENDNLKKQLALALIYLSAWKEKDFDTEVYRAWKGYDFVILDQLKEEGLISFSNKAKSVSLSQEGVKNAKAAVQKFLKKSD
jgi:hypothetical protein